MGIQKLNVCWNKVNNQNRVWDSFQGGNEYSHLSVAFNVQDKNMERRQPEGCAMIPIHRISHRVVDSGFDESKLGRWAWKQYKGFLQKF